MNLMKKKVLIENNVLRKQPRQRAIMLEMSQAESMVRPSGSRVDGLVPAEGLQERRISHGIFFGVTGTRKAPGPLVIESSCVPEGLLTFLDRGVWTLQMDSLCQGRVVGV